MMQRQSLFNRFSGKTAHLAGKPMTFIGAALIVVVWGITGPLFGFSDTWQLVINTGTTIITFLMVFLIQNTQNRDTEAMQLKLDELIVAIKSARNEVLDIENLDEDQLNERRQEMLELAEKARSHAEKLTAEIKKSP